MIKINSPASLTLLLSSGQGRIEGRTGGRIEGRTGGRKEGRKGVRREEGRREGRKGVRRQGGRKYGRRREQRKRGGGEERRRIKERGRKERRNSQKRDGVNLTREDDTKVEVWRLFFVGFEFSTFAVSFLVAQQFLHFVLQSQSSTSPLVKYIS